jgi:dGTPase
VVSADRGYVFHNRLTHSLKVAQIARRLAEKLLHEQGDLAERLGGLCPDAAEPRHSRMILDIRRSAI